jgi:NIMA (never in mitosis gene a)-related kinase
MDRYKKVKVVGKGSFGYAVLVQHCVDRKLYVMKIIDVSRMERKQKEEALNEVVVLKSLRHPFIVSYRESFMNKGCLCIVMDYADGGDLYAKITKQKQLGTGFSEEQILDWFVQICLAIKHIHERHILHRDLKTQNIFLTSTGHVKVGDFGIARVLQSTYDCAKTAIGTPYYLSPEICQERPYNQKSDIWSIGCMLYEMTSLKHAFDAKNIKGLVLKILRGSYPPIPEVYSADLRGIIEDLLQRSPQQRPSAKKVLRKDILLRRAERFMAEGIQIMPEYVPSVQRPLSRAGEESKASEAPGRTSESATRTFDEEDDDNFEEDEGQRVRACFLTVDKTPLPGVTEADSIFYRIEALRSYLEEKLGLEAMMRAYQYLQDPPADDDSNAELSTFLEPRKLKFVPLIYQLIVCEDKYFSNR